MNRRLWLLMLWAMLGLSTSVMSPSAFAQPDPEDDLDLDLSPGLAARLKWVRFGMVDGRVNGVSTTLGTNMSTSSTNPTTGRREKLAIDVTSGLPTIRYELASPQEELLLDLADGDRLTIVRKRQGSGGSLMKFSQRPGQPVELTIGEGEKERKWTAPDLWQLTLMEPAVCRAQLLPVIEVLRPSWRLSAMAVGIEESLNRWAAVHRDADRQRWQQLVAELASPKFAVRQRAERQLVAAGQSVVAYLESLDRSRLDAEQLRRIRSVVEQFDNRLEDSTDRVVATLAGNPQTWLVLMSRNDPAIRRSAMRQLAFITGQTIQFDPDADEAVRGAQLQRLRAKWPAEQAAAAPAN